VAFPSNAFMMEAPILPISMVTIVILVISIIIQLVAAFLALRLVWIIKKTPAWVLIALAICFMALRRCITLYQLRFEGLPTQLDQTTELVALLISILMLAGIAWLGPLFLSIKSSEEVLRKQLMQTCMDGIIANDLQGKIFIFNENATRMLGYKQEEVLGKITVQELYPPGTAREIKAKILDAAWGREGILENYETLARHKDGTLIPVWLSARILYEDGRQVGIVGHFRDLRDRKHLEEELVRSESLSALGRTAAYISHEIKNPLMLIGGFARQVLKNIGGDPEKNREKLRIIVDEIKRLESFVEEVGTYAKIAEPQMRLGDLNALVQETCQRLEASIQEKGITLQVELNYDLPLVQFDPAHLRQVILNIAKNSIEAMPEGGVLTIVSGRQEGRVFVQVSDTGEGISPEIMGKIFQPFFSTKSKGSGLGLAISQKIIDVHRGEITIASQPQKGCRVTIFLNEEVVGPQKA
jgi:two-component system NtrC family sensor kinase